MHNPIKAWSYSRLAMYERCPLQFKLTHIDKIGKPTSVAMERGDKIHKGIAAFLQGKSATLPVEVLAHPGVTKTIQEAWEFPVQSRQVEQQWGYTEAFKATGWFGNDTWFRSVLDLGLMYDDMVYEAVDWKTGKKYGDSAEQMETQAIAVFARFMPVQHVTCRLAYIDFAATPEFHEFPRTHYQKLVDKWRKRVQPLFTDTVFAPRPNDKCHFCDFSRSKGGQCAFG